MPNADGWTTVSQEAGTRIVFDTIGDVFVGVYEGTRHIVPEDTTKDEFDQQMFRGAGPDDEGVLYCTNGGYSIRAGLAKVEPGTLVRLTYVSDLPAKPGKNPMKDFRIDVKS
jgi:hypothetical protein